MVEKFKDLLDATQGRPADLATVLLAGTAGFVVDAGLNVVGFLSPGYVGIATATAALGVKQSIDASRKGKVDQRALKRLCDEQLDRAKRLEQLFRSQSRVDLALQLEREIQLLGADVSGTESVKTNLDTLVERFRDPPPIVPLPPPPAV